MATATDDEEEFLDDADIEDPWKRMKNLGPALELIADEEDPQRVTQARRLLWSLEMRIKEEADVDD